LLIYLNYKQKGHKSAGLGLQARGSRPLKCAAIELLLLARTVATCVCPMPLHSATPPHLHVALLINISQIFGSLTDYFPTHSLSHTLVLRFVPQTPTRTNKKQTEFSTISIDGFRSLVFILFSACFMACLSARPQID